jgi:hypothetical protein
MVVACLAENWKDDQTDENNMLNVGTCLNCLKEVCGHLPQLFKGGTVCGHLPQLFKEGMWAHASTV